MQKGPSENSRRSCLFKLLILAFLGYYGFGVGEVIFRYQVLKSEMRSQSLHAPSITNQTIRNRIVGRIESLGLPDEATKNLKIRRSSRPREITIGTEYQETIELPFYSHPLTLRPAATARL